MKNFMIILKEFGISILLIIIVAAVNVYFFKDKLPISIEVPKTQEYTSLVRENYKVVGDIQDAENPTETYAAEPTELEQYQTELRYVPGSVNPFVSGGSESNLPSETVSSPISSSSSAADLNQSDVTESEDSSNEDA